MTEIERIGPAGPDAATSRAAATVLRDLVAGGAALGWVEPPDDHEVSALLHDVTARGAHDGMLVVARSGGEFAGLGYWTRYGRPTHARNADVQKVAVARAFQRRGVARQIVTELIAAARLAEIEILTLDLRGDNAAASGLYESLGFRRYGVIERFVAVGDARFDKHCYALDLARS